MEKKKELPGSGAARRGAERGAERSAARSAERGAEWSAARSGARRGAERRSAGTLGARAPRRAPRAIFAAFFFHRVEKKNFQFVESSTYSTNLGCRMVIPKNWNGNFRARRASKNEECFKECGLGGKKKTANIERGSSSRAIFAVFFFHPGQIP